MADADAILTTLASIPVPYTDLTAADLAEIVGDELELIVGMPISGMLKDFAQDLEKRLQTHGVKIKVSQQIHSVHGENAPQAIDGVRNVIAVASGKGGVGKSTTAVNLALALAEEGARVGILDADIYGPSLPMMLGLGAQRPDVIDGKAMRPLRAHRLQAISMGSLVTEKTPMVWRGPMASGALQQLIRQTLWEDVDYLVVDMPPGTGDIQLTLSQSVPVSTAVIVTTPQDIALIDAKKAIAMFGKVNVPVSGIVENMAMHTCSQCGHQDAIFGEEGGERLAEEFKTRVLGRLPLKRSIREQVDSGRPPLVVDPQSAESLEYRKIALAIAGDIWQQSESESSPVVSVVDD